MPREWESYWPDYGDEDVAWIPQCAVCQFTLYELEDAYGDRIHRCPALQSRSIVTVDVFENHGGCVIDMPRRRDGRHFAWSCRCGAGRRLDNLVTWQRAADELWAHVTSMNERVWA